MAPRNQETQLSAMAALALVGQLGLTMALPVVAGVIGGALLDKWAGGTGLLVVGGVVVGLLVGILGVYQILARELPWSR